MYFVAATTADSRVQRPHGPDYPLVRRSHRQVAVHACHGCRYAAQTRRLPVADSCYTDIYSGQFTSTFSYNFRGDLHFALHATRGPFFYCSIKTDKKQKLMIGNTQYKKRLQETIVLLGDFADPVIFFVLFINLSVVIKFLFVFTNIWIW